MARNPQETLFSQVNANQGSQLATPVNTPSYKSDELLKIETSDQLLEQQTEELIIDITGSKEDYTKIFPTSNSTGNALTYIFRTANWAPLYSMYVTLPVQFTLYDSTTSATLTNAQATTAITNLRTLYPPESSSLMAYAFNKPFNPINSFFDNFQIKAGTDSCDLTEYANNTYPNIMYAVYMPTDYYDEASDHEAAYLNNSSKISINANTSTYVIATGVITKNLLRQGIFSAYDTIGKFCMKENQFIEDILTSVQAGIPLEIPIPLYALCPFFNQSPTKMVPPNFQFQLFAQFNTNPRVLYTFGALQLQGQAQLSSEPKPFITYKYYQFNTDFQLSMNTKFISNFMNYNYYSYRVTPVPSNIISVGVNQFTTSITQASTNPIAVLFGFFNDAITTDGQIINGAPQFKNSWVPNIYWKKIIYTVNGMQLTKMDMITSINNYKFVKKSDQEIMENMKNSKLLRFLDNFIVNLKSKGLGCPVPLVIDPCPTQIDRDKIGSLQGPVTSYVTCEFYEIDITVNPPVLKPVSTQEYRLVAIEIYQQQAVIDPSLTFRIPSINAKITGAVRPQQPQRVNAIPTGEASQLSGSGRHRHRHRPY